MWAKKLRWTDKAWLNFKHRVKKITGRSWGVSMEYRLQYIKRYLRSWFGYFGVSQC
ncbi:group II intron maturase-specific domain-containing protein [Ideonella oryzae]|uniref:group II intron maturase-specific domain-containing protein n=1 Tax=Ideonella oryzae TaxID=2937441 RepID=UPI00338D4A2F